MNSLTTKFCTWHLKREKGWQTIKRPGVDAFLEHLAQYYEIIVYSDYSNMVIYNSYFLFPRVDQYFLLVLIFINIVLLCLGKCSM